MKKKIGFFTLALLFLTQMISAQQPETIDVKTYTIYKEANWTSAYFVLTAVNSSGETVTYSGAGNYIAYPMMSCSPCNMPNTFSSNGFFSESFGVSYNWAFDSSARLYVTSVETEPIVLSPTILRKRQKITKEGAVSVRGRFEVNVPGRIVAFDNDVNLTGTYSATFNQVNYLPGRKIFYTGISYNLKQAQ